MLCLMERASMIYGIYIYVQVGNEKKKEQEMSRLEDAFICKKKKKK